MKADYVSAKIYNDPSDYTDADYHWYRESQAWSTDGLNQGENTVYYACTDGSANYLLGQSNFLYDSLHPIVNLVYNKKSQTVTIDARDDATSPGAGNYSGFDYLTYRYNINGGSFTAWSGAEQSGITVNITQSGTYRFQVVAYDNAGNSTILDQDITTSGGTPTGSSGSNSFHTNTTVVTHIDLTDSSSFDITPDHDYSVTLNIPGVTNQTKSFVLGAGGSEPVAFSWHTPSSPTTLNATYAIHTDSGDITDTATYYINELIEATPPDPKATDVVGQVGTLGDGGYQDFSFNYTNPDLTTSIIAPNAKSSYTWTEWSAEKKSITQPDGKISSGWTLTPTTYSASITQTTTIRPDPIIETATESNGVWTMKSGYPIDCNVQNTVNTDYTGDSSLITNCQNTINLFPEFNYEHGGDGFVDRVLDLMSTSGRTTDFQFKVNQCSTHGLRVQFIPLWFGDTGSVYQYSTVPAYTVKAIGFDCFCPAGELAVASTSSVNIKGNLYQDYHVGFMKNPQ